jgi:TorA maturation chaperone TorD
MDKQTRVYLYAFLSRVFSNPLDEKLIDDLRQNKQILSIIGDKSLEYFEKNSTEVVEDNLNVDFSSIFLMSSQPIESIVIDSKDEVLVGLQNPVMQFYFQNNYDLNLLNTHIQTPDHLAIELSFMQNLVQSDEFFVQKEFMEKHLLKWLPGYLLAIKDMANSIFYQELFDFFLEFLFKDYETIVNSIK